MKKLYTFITVFLVSVTLMAQTPQSFNYQAVLRDARGNIKANTATSIIISILQGSTTGTAVYKETHSASTDGYGLMNLEIGKGTATIGTFSGINWGTSTYFVKVNVDGVEMGTAQLLSVPYALYANNAGNGFSGNYLDLTNKPILFDGTWSSLISKPSFATVATSGSYSDLANKPILFNGTWSSLTGKPTTIAGFGITDAVATTGNQTIAGNKTFSGTTTVATPVNATDAANKAYVDAKTSGSTNGHYVGELFGGGIIVSVWRQSGVEHGLIASLTDISTVTPWSNITSTEIGVTAQNKIDGQPNTNAIISQSGHTSSAAKLCDDYTNTDTGTGIFSDWYLPSILELNQCYISSYVLNTILGVTNGFKFYTNATYWSSTEYSNATAYAFDFSYNVIGTDTGGNKGINLNLVRAVRKF